MLSTRENEGLSDVVEEEEEQDEFGAKGDDVVELKDELLEPICFGLVDERLEAGAGAKAVDKEM